MSSVCSCTGPVRDMTCGALVCPVAPWEEPEDGNWAAYCRQCVDTRELRVELVGDCERDEA